MLSIKYKHQIVQDKITLCSLKLWFLARCHRWNSLQNQIILLPQTWPKKGALTPPSRPPYPPLAVVGHPSACVWFLLLTLPVGRLTPSLISSSIHCPVHHIQSPAIPHIHCFHPYKYGYVYDSLLFVQLKEQLPFRQSILHIISP